MGARPPLVAYNLWLREPDLDVARALARALRSPAVRALGLAVGRQVQVSMNLLDPTSVGPAQVYDEVAGRVEVARAELVGLVPRARCRRWTRTGGGSSISARSARSRRASKPGVCR